jgi:SAM-dependent methyltransferase
MARNDHFSSFAGTYASYRPTYPPELFERLAGLAPAHEHAWDAATGTGQAAISLAAHFDRITATDVGAGMIAKATAHPKVTYAMGSAEESELPDQSVDLITIAMALHWVDQEAFWKTCRRVLKPNGVLAYWGYLLPCISKPVDAILRHYHDETVGPFWPPDRGPLMNLYADINPPAERLLHLDLEMHSRWKLTQIVGMLDSWSATHRAREQSGHDPLPAVANLLSVVWERDQEEMLVRWPLKLHAFRFNSSA